VVLPPLLIVRSTGRPAGFDGGFSGAFESTSWATVPPANARLSRPANARVLRFMRRPFQRRLGGLPRGELYVGIVCKPARNPSPGFQMSQTWFPKSGSDLNRIRRRHRSPEGRLTAP